MDLFFKDHLSMISKYISENQKHVIWHLNSFYLTIPFKGETERLPIRLDERILCHFTATHLFFSSAYHSILQILPPKKAIANNVKKAF